MLKYNYLFICFLLSLIQPSIGISNYDWNRAIFQYLALYSIDPNYINDDIINDIRQFIDDNSDVFNRITQLETDSEFLPYIEKYNTLKIQHIGQPINPNIKVVFSRNSLRIFDYTYYEMIAVCETLTDTIFMDRGSWNHYPEIFREFLLFHELGHYDLNRPHTRDFSIMNDSYTLLQLFIPYLLFPPGYLMERRRQREFIMGVYQNQFDSNLHEAFEVLKKELFSIYDQPINADIRSLFTSLKLPLPYIERSVLTFEQILTKHSWIIDETLKDLELSDQEFREGIQIRHTDNLDNMVYTLQQGRNSQNTQRIDEMIGIIREVQKNK